MPSAPLFEPEGVMFDLYAPKNEKLVIKIKEES
jgi:hypothetical protein